MTRLLTASIFILFAHAAWAIHGMDLRPDADFGSDSTTDRILMMDFSSESVNGEPKCLGQTADCEQAKDAKACGELDAQLKCEWTLNR